MAMAKAKAQAMAHRQAQANHILGGYLREAQAGRWPLGSWQGFFRGLADSLAPLIQNGGLIPATMSHLHPQLFHNLGWDILKNAPIDSAPPPALAAVAQLLYHAAASTAVPSAVAAQQARRPPQRARRPPQQDGGEIAIPGGRRR